MDRTVFNLRKVRMGLHGSFSLWGAQTWRYTFDFVSGTSSSSVSGNVTITGKNLQYLPSGVLSSCPEIRVVANTVAFFEMRTRTALIRVALEFYPKCFYPFWFYFPIRSLSWWFYDRAVRRKSRRSFFNIFTEDSCAAQSQRNREISTDRKFRGLIFGNIYRRKWGRYFKFLPVQFS